MNVVITIGEETRPWESASKDWINRAFSNANRTGIRPGVRVQVSEPGVGLTLSTPGASSGSGGGGSLNLRESEVVDSWLHHRLGSSNFTGGNLIAFLNDLERILQNRKRSA